MVKNKIEAYLLPNDIIVEETVLGSILLDFNELKDRFHLIKADFFYKDNNRFVFDAIKTLVNEGQTPDILTVTNQLRKMGVLDAIGGPFMLSELSQNVGSVFNFDEHLLILKELLVRREMAKLSVLTHERAINVGLDIFDTIDSHAKKNEEIQAIIHDQARQQTISDQVAKTIEFAKYREQMAKEGKISGIMTGLAELDKAIYGWQNGDLIVLAARPSMGKTALALHFAIYAAIEGKRVNIHSLEMPANRLIDRMLLNISTVDARKYNEGKMNEYDWNAINSAVEKLIKMDFKINDNSNTNIEFIHAFSRIQKIRNECDLVVIDYLQLINPGNDKKGRNREQEVSQISRSCKIMAKELNVPVILLSQLSRNVEQRGGNKRPMLSDLRESGAIEQDADVIIFPYRPSYYGITDEGGQDLTGTGELIIAKNRNGGLLDVPFKHNASMTSFTDFADQPLTALQPNTNFNTPF